jgi:hypothetical protein
LSAGTPTIFAPAKKKLLTGGFNLSADALKAALCTNVQAISTGFIGASGDARYADLTAECANGSGYTTGGQALTNVALNYFVQSATIQSAGSGGTNGAQVVTGTTGTGTKFQANVTITGGVITSINSIQVQGAYSVLPTDPTQEPVTGGALSGAKLSLVIGIELTFDNPTWSSSSIVAKYIVFYDNSKTNKDLLAYADLETTVGTGVSTTNGTLIYQVNAAGLFQLT